MKVTLVLLTFNHCPILEKTFQHNLANAGDKFDELIWVDNGSIDGVQDYLKKFDFDVTIMNKENVGVARGWNRAWAVATGDYIMVTDNDVYFPDNWLKTFKSYMFGVPKTRAVSMCFQEKQIPDIRQGGVICEDCNRSGFDQSVPTTECNDCHGTGIIPGTKSDKCMTCYGLGILGKKCPECDGNGWIYTDYHENGLNYTDSQPLYNFMFDRKLLQEVGYMREDFGLYGYDDVEWSYRAMRHIQLRKERSIVILDQFARVPQPETDEYENNFVMPTGETYKVFKNRMAHVGVGTKPMYKFIEIMNRNNQDGKFPRYNPWVGGEY